MRTTGGTSELRAGTAVADAAGHSPLRLRDESSKRLFSSRHLSALLVSAVLALAMFGAPSSASAAQDRYCINCFIYNQSYVINTRYHYNILSYVSYAGSGNRWMGAGAWGYAGFIWGWNSVGHSYNGNVNARAAAGYSGNNSGATSNAHASY